MHLELEPAFSHGSWCINRLCATHGFSVWALSFKTCFYPVYGAKHRFSSLPLFTYFVSCQLHLVDFPNITL